MWAGLKTKGSNNSIFSFLFSLCWNKLVALFSLNGVNVSRIDRKNSLMPLSPDF